jgi:predicted flap endonuclease-1-like 5' DNA nuclease
MRRIRLIGVILIALVGAWLVWRQVARRRRAPSQNGYEPGSSLPTWIPAPQTGPVVKGLASAPERTHNESDALTQPRPPAAPFAEQPGMDLPDTGPEDDPTSEPNAEDETAAVPPDDLLRIEGIGPKISTIVVAAGITSFAELAAKDVGQLSAILNEAGIHTANPSTWPEQAQLAAQGKWDELQELQDKIINGRLEV